MGDFRVPECSKKPFSEASDVVGVPKNRFPGHRERGAGSPWRLFREDDGHEEAAEREQGGSGEDAPPGAFAGAQGLGHRKARRMEEADAAESSAGKQVSVR